MQARDHLYPGDSRSFFSSRPLSYLKLPPLVSQPTALLALQNPPPLLVNDSTTPLAPAIVYCVPLTPKKVVIRNTFLSLFQHRNYNVICYYR